MIKNITVRAEQPADHPAVERLAFAAFENFQAEGVPKREVPDEHFLVHLLRDDPAFVPELNLVAEFEGEIIGQIMYSESAIIRPDGTITGTLTFGPVSVMPKWQRQGVGTLLIRQSLAAAREIGYAAVLITGHPAYYPRFGFVPASRYRLHMPNGSSFDAFMALELEHGRLGTAGGTWRHCAAFDAAENDKAAFQKYHARFMGYSV